MSLSFVRRLLLYVGVQEQLGRASRQKYELPTFCFFEEVKKALVMATMW